MGPTIKTNIVNVDMFAYIHFHIPKLAISCGLEFAFLMLLFLCDIIQVLIKLYILSRIFEKRE